MSPRLSVDATPIAEGFIYFDQTPSPAFSLEEDLDEAGWALFCRRAKIPEFSSA